MTDLGLPLMWEISEQNTTGNLQCIYITAKQNFTHSLKELVLLSNTAILQRENSNHELFIYIMNVKTNCFLISTVKDMWNNYVKGVLLYFLHVTLSLACNVAVRA